MKNNISSKNIPDSMFDEVGTNIGMSKEELKKDLSEGRMDSILSKVNDTDSKKIKKILSDPAMTEKILNSPQAIAIIRKLKGKNK